LEITRAIIVLKVKIVEEKFHSQHDPKSLERQTGKYHESEQEHDTRATTRHLNPIFLIILFLKFHFVKNVENDQDETTG
jgi:hypothetical protein